MYNLYAEAYVKITMIIITKKLYKNIKCARLHTDIKAKIMCRKSWSYNLYLSKMQLPQVGIKSAPLADQILSGICAKLQLSSSRAPSSRRRVTNQSQRLLEISYLAVDLTSWRFEQNQHSAAPPCRHHWHQAQACPRHLFCIKYEEQVEGVCLNWCLQATSGIASGNVSDSVQTPLKARKETIRLCSNVFS